MIIFMRTFAGVASVLAADSRRRALLAGVSISLVVHVLALFVLPEIRVNAPEAAAKVLEARFVSIFSGTKTPASIGRTEKTLPEPVSEKIKEDAAQAAVPVPDATIAPRVEPVVQPQMNEAQTQTASSQPAPSAAPTVQTVASSQSASIPNAQAVSPAAEVTSAALISRYRMALIGAARRYVHYPAQARENGWRGKVEVRLVIGADGAIVNLTIKTSSGYPVLDDQALEMVRKGKTVAQVPPELLGKEFPVDIPVVFDLRTG